MLTYTYIECLTCKEIDDKNALTGAKIDGKYYCQSCYEVKWNETCYDTDIFKKGIN